MGLTQSWALAAPLELAPAFTADADRWRRELGWDTHELWAAIERARVDGRLDGVVYRDDDGAIGGWTYFVARGGEVHCGALESADPVVTGALADALLASPAARRAERVLLFVYSAAPALDTVLRQRAFDVVPYDYRVSPLVAGRATAPGRPWDLRDLDATAVTLQAAYSGADPRRPFAPHGTLAEWRQYAADLVMSQGCGRFRPSLSIAVPGEGGRLDAVALVTDLGHGTAHLAQIAVTPSRRSVGLGGAMLDAITGQCAAAGFARLSLLVERGNRRATALYDRAGFALRASFLCAVRPGPRAALLDAPAVSAASRQ